MKRTLAVLFAAVLVVAVWGGRTRGVAASESAVSAAHGEAAGSHAEGAAHEAQDAHGGHGEGGEHHSAFEGKTFVLQLLNFGVLLFLLIKFGGSAVNKALLARHQQLKVDIAAAAEARGHAEERLRKQEARLANLEKEITAMRAGLQQEAEVEKARLIAAAEERAQRIKDEAAFLLDQQVKEGEATLRREAGQAAIKIAEELLRRSIGLSDQQRMVSTFVDDVAAAPAGARGKVS